MYNHVTVFNIHVIFYSSEYPLPTWRRQSGSNHNRGDMTVRRNGLGDIENNMDGKSPVLCMVVDTPPSADPD